VIFFGGLRVHKHRQLEQPRGGGGWLKKLSTTGGARHPADWAQRHRKLKPALAFRNQVSKLNRQLRLKDIEFETGFELVFVAGR